MGTVYFEKDKGVSGFKSFVDPAGADWIASYLEPGLRGEYRGFPNSIGNFGHAGRDGGSTTTVVDGRTEGDVVVLERLLITPRGTPRSERLLVKTRQRPHPSKDFLIRSD